MPAPSTTLLIEGSFSELAEELAQYVDSLAKTDDGSVQADCEQLLNSIREAEQSQEPVDEDAVQKQKDEVLKKITTKAAVLNSAPEREFASAYNLLISLASQSPISEQIFARICQYLSEQPINSSSTISGANLAVQTLTTVFNVLPLASEARYHVFLAILKVLKSSSSVQAFEALISQLETNIPTWLEAWQLDEEDKRRMFVSIADVASSVGSGDLTYKYLLAALGTISPESASEPESQELARRALRVALTNPTVTDFAPLTASDAIMALRRSDSNLFDLLEIFSSDDYASYTDFLETNELSALGIEDSAAEVLSNKIRLLTLATIAASSQSRSVPYSSIASALQVPSEDVEMWVIDTIRAGLVEGKLSQMKQEFLVQRATYRVFGEKQWAEIQGRLMVWRRSLESVLTVVKAERERFLREGPMTSNSEGINGYDGEGNQHHHQRGGDHRGQRRGGRGGGRGNRGDRGDREPRGDHQQQHQPAAAREVEVGGGD